MPATTEVTMKAFRILGFVALAALAGHASAQVTPSDRWTYRASIYGFFPSVHAKSEQNTPFGQIDATREPDTYLSNLQSTFMGAFEARKHPWSIQGDFIYLNFGDLKSRPTAIRDPDGGDLEQPAQTNLSTDLKGGLAQLAVGFAIANTETNTLDAIAGVRFLQLKAGLDWEFGSPVGTFPPTGSVEKKRNVTDAVVGFRGRFIVGKDKWFVPWYFDAGTGTSRYTYQVATGAGYRFGWGDASLVYRHLYYKFGEDFGVRELEFSGPMVGATFRF
jgi:hypothetical protein